MNTNRKRVLGLAAAMALPVLWAATVGDASARPPRSASSTTTRTGPAGNSATRQSSVATNGAGGYRANSTMTGPAGNTATRQQTGSYDAASKSYTRSSTTTGPAGQQANTSSTIQATGNGYQRDATHTGPNGNSVTSQGHAAYNASTGTLNQSRTVMGPNGQSATETKTINVGAPPAQPSN